MKCYRCNITLKADTPPEHIIQNSIGGRLKSNHLLCLDCNNVYGKYLDSALRNTSFLQTILDIKIDRGKIKSKLKSYRARDGAEFEFDKNKRTKILDRSPEEDNEGNKLYYFKDLNHARKVLPRIFKDEPNFNLEEKIKELNFEKRTEDELRIKTDLITSENVYKAIAKIAINFYLFSKGDVDWIEQILNYIEPNSSIKNIYVSHFQHPLNKFYQIHDQEVSHLIYLYGGPSSNCLFCYVDLFNTHSFIVKLLDPYYGEEIENTYCFDLLNKKELNIKVNLRLNKTDFDKLHFQITMNINEIEVYKQKLNRVLKIANFEPSGFYTYPNNNRG